VRVALLGCGNVGGALALLLAGGAAEIAARTGVALELAGVAVLDTGRSRPGVPDALLTGDAAALAVRPDIDVVVELIGGIDPARALTEAALDAGKPVVTGNKALLAEHGADLAQLAADRGVDLLYEAAVAGAIPVIRPLRQSLAGERVLRVMGIVNGTTNFILTRMAEEGSDYEDALAEAQALGLAERDPTADVAGDDAAAKAAILAGLAFGVDVTGASVPREGITAVRAVDVAFADRLGYVVKLLAVAERVDGGESLSVRVHPAMVPRSHPLASVRGAFNAVFIEGASAGELMLYGQGAGGGPTAAPCWVTWWTRRATGGPAGPVTPPAASRRCCTPPRTSAPPSTCRWTWWTVPGCWPAWPRSSGTTACPSGPWSRWAWATRRDSSS
jgi:homoserine dehydrogenase